MTVLAQLRQKGCTVELTREGKVRCTHPGLAIEAAEAVRQTVMRCKAEIARELRQELARKIFRPAIEEVQRAWVPGSLDQHRQMATRLWHMSREADRRLDEVWARFVDGLASQYEFELAVLRWRDLHLDLVSESRLSPRFGLPGDKNFSLPPGVKNGTK